MSTLKEWFTENLSEYAEDIANHGADSGFPHMTYTNECAELFDQFAAEIWEMAVDDAESMGHKNVMEMVAGFGRADMLYSYDGFKNLMWWYACEAMARNLVDSGELSEEK